MQPSVQGHWDPLLARDSIGSATGSGHVLRMPDGTTPAQVNPSPGSTIDDTPMNGNFAHPKPPLPENVAGNTLAARAMEIPAANPPPTTSREFVLNEEMFDNLLNDENAAPQDPISNAPTAMMAPPQPMETAQMTPAAAEAALNAASSQPQGEWPTNFLTLNCLDLDNKLIKRIDPAKIYYIPRVLYDIQIRLFAGAPVSIRVPDIPIRMLLDDLVPENSENQFTRRVRRTLVDNLAVLRDSNIAPNEFCFLISTWVAEAKSSKLGLKLTFLDASKGIVPPEFPSTWPEE